MQQTGKVTVWKDDKGFGFITPTAGGKDVFFHISAVARTQDRPAVGDLVAFTAVPGKNGKMQAEQVRCIGSKATPAPETASAPLRFAPYLIMVFCLGSSAMALVKNGLPLVLAYPVFSMFTYAAYVHDKQQAQSGGWRVPEVTLHLLELLGGWMGGYFAQQSLRHKTVKTSYQSMFWGIVFLHCLGWMGYLLLTSGLLR